MTATEELRRMLDERGVEWTKPKRIWWELIDCEPDDSVTIVEGVTIEAATDGMLVVYPLTPEQAIEATLGRGTCRRVLYKPTNVLVCSECGAGMPRQLDKYCYLHYCPNCGREVVTGAQNDG